MRRLRRVPGERLALSSRKPSTRRRVDISPSPSRASFTSSSAGALSSRLASPPRIEDSSLPTVTRELSVRLDESGHFPRRAAEPTLCGRQGNTHLLRYFLELEAFHVSQHERGAFANAQLIEEP